MEAKTQRAYNHLELEVGISGDGHELDVTWPPQDDMVRPGEVGHLESEHFGAVVACVPKSYRQSNLYEGDKMLAQDHSVERVWAASELVSGKP
jgi:hypothetical protein